MKKWLIGALLAAMLLGLIPVSAECAHVTLYADPAPPTVTLDGQITEEEWGQPIASYTYQNVKEDTEGWGTFTYFRSEETLARQFLELYARRDSENLYFAFRFNFIHHVDTGYTNKDGWRHAGMKLAFGAFDPELNIENGAEGERWLAYTIRPKYNTASETFTTVISAKGNLGLSEYTKPRADVYIDENEYIYEYEVIIPYADTHGVITAETEDIVLSYEMTDARLVDFESGNRWFISKAVRLATEESDPSAFASYNPLRLIYGEEPAPVVPETPAEPAPEPAPFPWYILGIPAAVLVAVLAVVFINLHVRKEKQK